MLIAHTSICLDCFPFYLLRICSLFCVLKKKCELYNSISESHHCNISDVYILIFFFSQRVGHDCISNEVLPSFTALSPADFLNLLNLWPPPPPSLWPWQNISGRQLCQWTTTVTEKSLLTHVFLLLSTHTYV